MGPALESVLEAVARAPVDRLAEIASTNVEAMRRAAAGERGPLWILAERQTAGRGRSGRSWSSEPGNLHASLLFDLPASAPPAYQLSLVAGVAAVDAIRSEMREQAPAGLRLKWPNDVLVGVAKAGGILIESTTIAGATLAVIGIGLNLVSHPQALDRAAIHLGASAPAPSRDGLVAALSEALARRLTAWNAPGGVAALIGAWLARAGPIGEPLQVHGSTGQVRGTFAGLDVDGALLIRDQNGAVLRFSYGDVTLPP